MAQFLCLFMENEDHDYGKFGRIIKLAWDYEPNNVRSLRSTFGEISFERARDPDEAIAMLENSNKSYGIMIADLLFPAGGAAGSNLQFEEGLRAVEVAYELVEQNMAILAISGGEALGHSGLRERFLNGNDGRKDYIGKRDLGQNVVNRAGLASKLRRILKFQLENESARSETNSDFLELDANGGVRMLAAIESVGIGTMATIVQTLVPNALRANVALLSQGFSGALMFRLVTFDDLTSRSSLELVLKLSRDLDKLAKELRSAPEVGRSVPGTYVEYRCSVPVSFRGWHAIAAGFVGRSVTLRDWLVVENPKRAPVVSVLTQAFESLGRDYARQEYLADMSAVEQIWGNSDYRARVRSALDELLPVASVVPGATVRADRLVDFCEGTSVVVSSRPSYGALTCICHGDLHGANLLVRPDVPRTLLIDPARRGTRFWASDLARLSTDLWLQAWDAGPKAHLWANLGEWRSSVKTWAGDRAVRLQTGHPNAATWAALKWIRDNRHRVFQDTEIGITPDWQFYLALAVEFLVFSTFQEIPTPKRVLALCAADDLLEEVIKSVS